MLSKKLKMQGAQIFRNEAYMKYAAMTEDVAQHSRLGFYGSIKLEDLYTRD